MTTLGKYSRRPSDLDAAFGIVAAVCASACLWLAIAWLIGMFRL